MEMGSLPPGSASPKRTSASAVPPSWPARRLRREAHALREEDGHAGARQLLDSVEYVHAPPGVAGVPAQAQAARVGADHGEGAQGRPVEGQTAALVLQEHDGPARRL